MSCATLSETSMLTRVPAILKAQAHFLVLELQADPVKPPSVIELRGNQVRKE